jgi:hypothetical protein
MTTQLNSTALLKKEKKKKEKKTELQLPVFHFCRFIIPGYSTILASLK